MPYRNTYLILATLVALTIGSAQGATPFSSMCAEEVCSLLASRESAETVKGSATEVCAVSAKDAVAIHLDNAKPSPVSLNAFDMVTKIYGVLNPEVNREECIRQSQNRLRLTPVEDEGALWVESDKGFGVNYYGMNPETCAMVRFDSKGSHANDYGFFFLFPYSGASRESSTAQQTRFCGQLLQEMADCGMALDLNTASPDLFEAVGEFMGNMVDVRLLDDQGTDGGDGRFILILSIEPGGFTPADNQLAELPASQNM